MSTKVNNFINSLEAAIPNKRDIETVRAYTTAVAEADDNLLSSFIKVLSLYDKHTWSVGSSKIDNYIHFDIVALLAFKDSDYLVGIDMDDQKIYNLSFGNNDDVYYTGTIPNDDGKDEWRENVIAMAGFKAGYYVRRMCLDEVIIH